MLGLSFGAAACESDTSSSPTPDGGPSTTPPVETCKPPTSGPTVHHGNVGPNEVWTADASPHIIESSVSVRDGATLTIEPCAEVRIAKGQSLNVAWPNTPQSGTLIAEGTAERPIHFLSNGAERWGSLAVQAPGTARLAYATFDNGGGGDFQDGATLAVYGDSLDGADAIVSVNHVTITKSLGVGAWLSRGAAFVKGSTDLTIKESGNEENPYPLEIEEHAFDDLPSGAYTGNAVDEILVNPVGGSTPGTGLLADATLHDRGVPYRIGKSEGISLRIGGREDERLVTLTIEPGVTMKFVRGGGLEVQHVSNQKPSTAALRAIGTADKPIVMTSASPTPAAGDWRGVWFAGIPGSTNQLDHVRLEHAGGDCGCIFTTCSNISTHAGAVIFTAEPASAFITNTTIAHSAGHGFSEGYEGSFVNFRPTNTFEDVSGCAQTRPRDKTMPCSNPLPACDGL